MLKTLQAIEFVVKNGSPQCVIYLKREIYKITSLNHFSYLENGLERGKPIREKGNLICDLLSSEEMLLRERAEAFEYRHKFYPGAGPTSDQAGITDPSVFQG